MCNRLRFSAPLALALCSVGLSLLASPAGQQAATEAIQGEAFEDFLQRAKIVALKDVPVGITSPRMATLDMDGTTRFAIFKTVDERRRGYAEFSVGKPETDFQDSYKLEIAAYRLDVMIGLDMVPATVERVVGRERGSLQLWVDTEMAGGDQLSEKLRLERGIRPSDPLKWSEELYRARSWDALIANVDRNTTNLLVGRGWRLVLIDHSRTFRRSTELAGRDGLSRFSRSFLTAIGKLDEESMTERLKEYLTAGQMRSLLARRDLIVELARAAVEKNGEGVLFR